MEGGVSCGICLSMGHSTVEHWPPRGYLREKRLAEIADRAAVLKAQRTEELAAAARAGVTWVPNLARVALHEANRAAVHQGDGWRTRDMLRACALDCAAHALLALEEIDGERRGGG